MTRFHKLLASICVIGLIGLIAWLLRSKAQDAETSTPVAVSSAAPGRSGPARGPSTTRSFSANDALLAKPKASLSGTVSDEAGAPIAGAQVCAVLATDEVEPSIEVPCVRTASDGRYRIEQLLGVGYEVHASAPRYQPGRFNAEGSERVRLVSGRERGGVDIVLRTGGVQLKGVVRDISGGVVEDAVVWSRAFASRGSAYGRTDADGTFELWVSPGPRLVTVAAEGYAKEDQRGTVPGFTFELFLTPESILAGKVFDVATGEPVAGAKVSAQDASGGFGAMFGSENFAYSDAEGNFRIAGLAPGAYKARAHAREGYGESEQSVHLALGATAEDVEVRLHPAVSVDGVVVIKNGEERRPCERGSASLTHVGTGRSRRGVVRAEGRVEITGVLPGTYEVTASCTGFVAEEHYGQLEIEDEPIEQQQWEVTEGIRIRGRVVGAEQSLLATATVAVRSSGGAPRGRSNFGRDTTLGPDGAFEITGLVPGTVELSVSGRGVPRAPEPMTVELVEGEDLEDVEVEVVAGGGIRGRVEDASGAPIVGASIRTEGPGGRSAPTSTGDDGTFEVTGLLPGTHRVSATKKWKALRAPNSTDDDKQGSAVDVEEGGMADVTLVVEAQDKAIRGRVVDQDGSPVVDAFVRAERESDSSAAAASRNVSNARWGGWNEQPVMTDEDGAFEVDKLSAGDYTLRAWRRGGGEGFAEHIGAGSEGVEVSIEGTGRIEGVVTFAEAGAPSQFTVRVRDQKNGFSRQESFFETDGKFVCDELPPGDYELTAEAEGGSGTTAAKLAEAQAQSGVKIELRKHVAVKGKVVDAETGEPVPGLLVSIRLQKGGSWNLRLGGGDKRNETSAQGEFEIDSAPTGAVLVTVLPRAFGSDSDYGFGSHPATIRDENPYEMPPIKVARRRVKRGEVAGDLGYKIKEREAGTSWTESELEVGFVEPGGPAAKAGLEVGAVITSVDGHSVTGDDRGLYYTLSTVKAGVTIKLGLKNGKTVALVAAAKN